MYLTVKETAEYLSMPESYIESMIVQNKIRTVYDGEQYLILKERFNPHLERWKNIKRQLADYYSGTYPRRYRCER